MGEKDNDILTIDFLRKYIKFCKIRAPPILSKEASEEIAERYVNMRLRFQQSFIEDGEKKSGKLAVTTRTLEALIRLSTAHAKLKLRKDKVLPEDVHEAYRLMMAAREEEVPTLPGAPAGAAPGP